MAVTEGAGCRRRLGGALRPVVHPAGKPSCPPPIEAAGADEGRARPSPSFWWKIVSMLEDRFSVNSKVAMARSATTVVVSHGRRRPFEPTPDKETPQSQLLTHVPEKSETVEVPGTAPSLTWASIAHGFTTPYGKKRFQATNSQRRETKGPENPESSPGNSREELNPEAKRVPKTLIRRETTPKRNSIPET